MNFFRYCFFITFKFTKILKEPLPTLQGINSNITNAIIFSYAVFFSFNFTGVLQETIFFINGDLCVCVGGGGGEKGHYSVTYNVSFTKIICISMSHRLNVFFFFFFALKKNTNDQDGYAFFI